MSPDIAPRGVRPCLSVSCSAAPEIQLPAIHPGLASAGRRSCSVSPWLIAEGPVRIGGGSHRGRIHGIDFVIMGFAFPALGEWSAISWWAKPLRYDQSVGGGKQMNISFLGHR